jgi:hypothetical protein
MKKNIISASVLALSYCLFSACGSTPDPAPKAVAETIKHPAPNPHELLLKQVKAMDTTTSSGLALHYNLDSSNKVSITLARKKLKRTFKSEQFPQPGTYTYKCEWPNYVGMKNSCGTSCWTLTLLPLNKKGGIVTYDYDLASDSRKNLLFCKKHLEGNEYFVTNVETRKKKKILLPALAGNGLPGSGIDSIAFVKQGLFIKWKIAGAKEKSEIFKLNI